MRERFKIKHFANLPYSSMQGYTRRVEAYLSDKWAGSINEQLVSGEADKESIILVNEAWVDADSAYLACRRYIKYYESGKGQLTNKSEQ